MSIFKPARMFKSVMDIKAQFLKENDIRLILLDVDNTLTTHNNPVPAKGVEEWLKSLEEFGIKALIFSNNKEERVSPFAKKIELDYCPRACKPLTFKIKKICIKYNVPKDKVAIIGDQIFTDILCGNLKGIKSFLVEPYEFESGFFFKLKRRFEKPILKSCRNGERYES